MSQPDADPNHDSVTVPAPGRPTLPWPVVMFDGECVFCAAGMRFIAARDRTGTLRYAALESPAGRLLRRRFAVPDKESVALIEPDGRVTQDSAASLRLAGYLTWPWRWARALLLVPPPLRDLAYRGVVRVRYLLMGRRAHCGLPSPELRSRTLESEADVPAAAG